MSCAPAWPRRVQGLPAAGDPDTGPLAISLGLWRPISFHSPVCQSTGVVNRRGQPPQVRAAGTPSLLYTVTAPVTGPAKACSWVAVRRGAPGGEAERTLALLCFPVAGSHSPAGRGNGNVEWN